MTLHAKKAGIVMLLPEKVDFKPKMVRRKKEGDYIMIKWSVHQEDKTITNI